MGGLFYLYFTDAPIELLLVGPHNIRKVCYNIVKY